MNNQAFNTVIKDQLGYCESLLITKGEEYDNDTNDRLHSFKTAAQLQGITPKQALAGMLAKHTISIFDMCQDKKHFTADKWEEKITDHINYLLLLKAMVIEEMTEELSYDES